MFTMAMLIESIQRSNVAALSILFGMQRLRFLQFCSTPLQGRFVRIVPKLVPQAHGNSPMRHGTLRIVLCHLLESLLRLLIPERVQKRDSAFKSLLRGG